MSDKPLIAHVLYRLDTGGMERVVVSLVKATRNRYRHAVITLAGFGAMRGEIEGIVEACVSLDKRPGKDWRCYLRLRRALRSLGPDLVQTYNLGTLDLAPIVKTAGVRRLVHAEHGRDAADPSGDIRKYQRLRRFAAMFIDRFVAVSPDLRKWLTARVRIAPSKVAYIANGIDADAFAAARPRSTPRALLDRFAPPGSVLIANVARLDKVKDQAGLLAAFKLLREQPERSACRLIIIGAGPEQARLERQIAELGLESSVRLLGNRSDVAALLAECDVFALSSIAEGMPLTVLEAMAAGLPVVATDVGSVATVVDDGMSGTLVPASDPDAFAQALAMYVDDAALRLRHGEVGRARVNAQFGEAAMVSSYIALYDELLGQRARPAAARAATREGS